MSVEIKVPYPTVACVLCEEGAGPGPNVLAWRDLPAVPHPGDVVRVGHERWRVLYREFPPSDGEEITLYVEAAKR